MSRLVIRRGIAKLAAAEDGPSFEQQFGILANALVSEKYPKLDRCKLAFQLIDKDGSNAKAVGACVYMIGKTVVFVPAFYKGGSIKTGDMMFLAKVQQFLPLSDPWLAWVQDRELQQPGEALDKDLEKAVAGQNAATVKEISDPIVKTACVYLRGLLRTDPDLTKKAAEFSLLDTVAGMGRHAAEALLDNLVDSKPFLNSALRFYSGDQIDSFAKKAAAMAQPSETVSVILPFTKEAKALTPDEKAILDRDGYIIKTAAETLPDVIRHKRVRDTFKVVSAPGMLQLLKMDGAIKKCLVMRTGRLELHEDELVCDGIDRITGLMTYDMPTMDARRYMKPRVLGDGGFCAMITESASTPQDLADDTMTLADANNEDFRPDMLSGYGKPMTPGSVPRLRWGDWMLCPDGRAYKLCGDAYARERGWYNTSNYTVVVGDDKAQKSPIVTASMCIVPPGSRYVGTPGAPEDIADGDQADEVKGKHALPFVTWRRFEVFLAAYNKRHYRKVRVTSNGSEAYIGGDSSDGRPMSIKEASLHLVRDYGIAPGVARSMLGEVLAGAASSSPKSELYLISKTAADDGWDDASIPMHQAPNQGDRQEYRQMPTVLEDPAQLQQAVQAAAENGIKEVFDVTAFKLLVRQNRFLEEIHDDLPTFMRVLDSLCRKLFLLYWHTEDFERQYGTVKLKSLEDSLKTTLDSLSELTIFFKLRTVDGDTGIGQDGGDLMQGHDI